ncbi:hypothetical protein KP509_26G054800 [Ceratopteris richardii]|uniref:Transcription initiation factor IIB n=1 Tax=Ceratopteris richardii TaxID=49495 RepID=A0A8T2RMV7_CERRI|nr:hypothetical protein KP509_26G054800 [Ceratopteris richardii]
MVEPKTSTALHFRFPFVFSCGQAKVRLDDWLLNQRGTALGINRQLRKIALQVMHEGRESLNLQRSTPAFVAAALYAVAQLDNSTYSIADIATACGVSLKDTINSYVRIYGLMQCMDLPNVDKRILIDPRDITPPRRRTDYSRSRTRKRKLVDRDATQV